MTPETSYQNQDLISTNPLLNELTPNTAESPSPKKFFIPQDPKIKILMVLGIVLFILSILSLVMLVVKTNSNTNQPLLPQPTPTTIITPVSTTSPVNPNIPENIRSKFDQIDKNNQVNPSFDPPQIDTSIGQ